MGGKQLLREFGNLTSFFSKSQTAKFPHCRIRLHIHQLNSRNGPTIKRLLVAGMSMAPHWRYNKSKIAHKRVASLFVSVILFHNRLLLVVLWWHRHAWGNFWVNRLCGDIVENQKPRVILAGLRLDVSIIMIAHLFLSYWSRNLVVGTSASLSLSKECPCPALPLVDCVETRLPSYPGIGSLHGNPKITLARLLNRILAKPTVQRTSGMRLQGEFEEPSPRIGNGTADRELKTLKVFPCQAGLSNKLFI